MSNVVIYTKDYCPYCVKAKALLKRRNIAFKEIDISHDAALQQEMIEKSGGRRSVPQIFINGNAIGGCDDLYALDASGKLNTLLAS
jgi:glutaredoxin 3